MVEAGDWGQDWQGVMRDNAQFITNLDPLENTILAVHMYEAYPAAVVVESYLQAFHDVDLPIVISEFAPKARKRTNEYQSPYPLKTVNAEAIIDVAHEKGVGYIGWSWKPNPVGYSELDLVDPITSALTPWGELLINSEKGIKATAQAATHYDDSIAENNEPVAVLDLRGGGGCDDAHAMLSAAGSTDIDGDSLSYSWRITNHLDSDVVTSTDVSWTFPLTYRIQYTVELTVDDGRRGVSSTTRPVGHFASACRHLTQSSAASWSSGRSSEAPTPPSSSSVASVSSAVSSSAAAPASYQYGASRILTPFIVSVLDQQLCHIVKCSISLSG